MIASEVSISISKFKKINREIFFQCAEFDNKNKRKL